MCCGIFNLMNIKATTLPEDTTLLKQMLVDFQGHHDKETGILLEEISLLRAQLYGRKSEKFKPVDGPQPLPLFDMPEPTDGVDDTEEEETHVPAHNRRKRGRKALPDNLPRVERVHDIDDADKICACGCELNRIGEEVSEQLLSPHRYRLSDTFAPNMPARTVKVWKMMVLRLKSLLFLHRLYQSPLPVPACCPIF